MRGTGWNFECGGRLRKDGNGLRGAMGQVLDLGEDFGVEGTWLDDKPSIRCTSFSSTCMWPPMSPSSCSLSGLRWYSMSCIFSRRTVIGDVIVEDVESDRTHERESA